MILPQAIPFVGAFIALSILTELVMYQWAYRSPSFRSTKAAVKTYKEPPAEGLVGAKPKSGREKKAERAQSSIKRDAAKEVSGTRMKQGVVMMVSLFVMYKVVGRYIHGSVATLPFEPVKFVRNVSQRGLEDPELTDCAYAFILALCQTGVRPSISMLLDLGPSRRMLNMGSFSAALDAAQKQQ